MKSTYAEKATWLLLVVQVVIVIFFDSLTTDYPKIYEDILGMIAVFLLIIFSFIRELAAHLKGEK